MQKSSVSAQLGETNRGFLSMFSKFHQLPTEVSSLLSNVFICGEMKLHTTILKMLLFLLLFHL